MKILQGAEEKRIGIYYEYDPYSRPLGEGGMGVVYKGFRVNMATKTRQVVAIKAMRTGLPQIAYEKAEREASIRLRNDNLVEMLGFIVTNEKEMGGAVTRHYYVVSEFINGVVLGELLKGNYKDRDGIEIPFAKKLYMEYTADKTSVAVRVIKRVLAGIMALHDKGYIHRDLKPSNIMIAKEGNLKIIDFGIAKNVKNLNSGDKMLTSTGEFIGTAEYAPPELIVGAVNDQDYTTDIYQIGILFYELLVGHLPFEGPRYDILQAQLKNPVPVSDIERGYRSIVKKATQKKQADRYQSCSEMRTAIDNPSIDWFDWIPLQRATLTKVAAGLLLAGGISAVIALIDPKPEEGTNTTEEIVDVSEQLEVDTLGAQYEKALANLESSDFDSVRIGWEEMKELAKEKDYAKAKMEVGLTCFSDKVNIDKASRRRAMLNLTTDDNDLCVEMLSSVKDSGWVSGEALAALGIRLFRQGDYGEAHEVLKKALDRVDGQLKEKVEEYLKM